jgi:hypothetical protein
MDHALGVPLWSYAMVAAFWAAGVWIAIDVRRHRAVCDFVWRMSFGSERAPEWYVRVTRPAIVIVMSVIALGFAVELMG